MMGSQLRSHNPAAPQNILIGEADSSLAHGLWHPTRLGISEVQPPINGMLFVTVQCILMMPCFQAPNARNLRDAVCENSLPDEPFQANNTP